MERYILSTSGIIKQPFNYWKLMMEQQEPPMQQFTDEEVKELRAIIESQKRVDWLWSSIRTGAAFVTAVIVGFTVFSDAATRLLKIMVGK